MKIEIDLNDNIIAEALEALGAAPYAEGVKTAIEMMVLYAINDKRRALCVNPPAEMVSWGEVFNYE